MAVQLIFKNSAVKDQKPLPGAIAKGELALNSHEESAGLFLLDTSGAIQQVGGVAIQNDAPSSPVRGTAWLKRDDLFLRIHDGTAWQKVAGGRSGGGGGTITIIGDDGLTATKLGNEYTLSFDFDANKGLGIESGKAVVKLKSGGGLDFESGQIEVNQSDLNFVLLEDGGTQQDITGGGGLSIDGLGEFKGGVKITGGSDAEIYSPGIGSTNGGNLRLATSGSAFLISRDNYTYAYLGQISSKFSNGLAIDGESLRRFNPNSGDISSKMFVARTDRQDFTDVNDIDCYLALFPQPTGQSILPTTSITGFTAKPTTTTNEYDDPSLLFTGFKSSLQRSTNFNFYAGGLSPNYFKGNTLIGGTNARNTLELWLSTLTEEQREEYEAGTYPAPANVITPGDGSYARQWWYDQQSPENKTRIDDGDLPYPSDFQAANFTDTFTLAPNISLLSDGQASFVGDITCTDTTKGLVLTSPDGTLYRLTVANDGTLSTSAV